MKRQILTCISLLLVVIAFFPATVVAAPTSKQQTKKAVTGWLKTDVRPLGMVLGQQIDRVETFSDAEGQLIYRVVYLEPTGFVIVPADDLVEPIIAFVSGGTFDPSLDNPLGALVSQDMPNRIATVRNIPAAQAEQLEKKIVLTGEETAFEISSIKAKNKWVELQDYADTVKAMGVPGLDEAGEGEGEPLDGGLPGISDVRVEPLAQSR